MDVLAGTNGNTKQTEIWLQAILDSAADLAAFSKGIGTSDEVALSAADLLWECDLEKRQSHDVDAYRGAAYRLLTLASNILDLSNIDSGCFQLNKVDFDLKSLIDRMIDRIGCGKKPFLKLIWPTSLPRTFSGDLVRVRQILSSVLYYAVRCAKSEEILISVKPDTSSPNRLHFAVSDVASESEQGSLDLQICRSLVEQMGGKLQTNSEQGKGTALSFDLAFSASAQAETNLLAIEETRTTDSPDGAPVVKIESELSETDALKILIAEDSEDSRFLLREFLKKGPYAITFAENGQQALEAARITQYDLILMDIQMPVMDGLTATRLIREMEQEQGRPATPLLALTANTRKSDIELSLAAGCNAHVLKPISKIELLNTVKKYAPMRAARSLAPSFAEVTIPAGFEEAAKRYIIAKKNDIPRLMRLLEMKEFEQLRIFAHDMKGTGTSYGFPNLTWLGTQMECCAIERNGAELSNQMLQLFRYARETAEMMAPS